MERKDVLQLKLGFIAVRNRTVEEKMNLKNARKREKEFFRGHIASSAVGTHCLGIDALINRLADLYADRIQNTFPQMRKEIQNKLDTVREQLIKFPVDLDTPIARIAKYHELADLYVENVLKARFSAFGDDHTSLVNILHRKFKTFQEILEKQTKELHTEQYFHKISCAMSSCAGEQLPNFLPYPLMKRFIEEKIGQLWHTTKSLVNDCFFATSGLLLNNDNDQSPQEDMWLEKLLPAFHDIVDSYLGEQRQVVLDQLEALINLEKNEPYTMNDAYMKKLEQRDDDDDDDDTTRTYEEAVDDMVQSIRSYWDVIQKRFLDYATLTIRARFIFLVCDGVRDRLRRVPSEQCDFVDSYLAEDAHTRTQRKNLQQTFDLLQKVLGILGGQKLVDARGTAILPVKNELDEIAIKLRQEEAKLLFKSKVII